MMVPLMLRNEIRSVLYLENNLTKVLCIALVAPFLGVVFTQELWLCVELV
jgi:hypothetical protein